MGLSKNAARTLEQVKSVGPKPNDHWHMWKLTISAKGLSILYGADYFTEEEWIKLDGLIHKGQYVFTRGPQTNILDEELMSFDDFEDTILPTAPTQKELATVADRRVPTPISEKPSLNFSEPTQNDTSADTSANASADEGYANVTPTIAEKAPSPATAAPTPAPAPANGGLAWYTQAQLDEVKAFNANLTRAGQKAGAKKGKGGPKHSPSASRNFPPPESNYGSVADLDPQAPAWDAEQASTSRQPAWDAAPETSASQQPHWSADVESNFVPVKTEWGVEVSPAHQDLVNLDVELPSASKGPAVRDAPQQPFTSGKPAWETGSEDPNAVVDDGFPFVAPDDIYSVNQTSRASEWPQEEPKDENPSPTSAEQESRITSWADEVNAEDTTRVPVYEPVIQEPLNSRFTNGTDNVPQVVEKFIQVHGKQPKSSNDVHQPRNSELKSPKRPDSRASVRTATRPVVPSKIRTVHAASGTIFLAHADSPKRSNIAIEVKAGDSIKYIKHVSGIMHTGMNLRTKLQGQFPETVLEPVQSRATLIQQQRSAIQTLYGRDGGNTFTSALTHGLDRVESTNAAEWEKESETSRPTTSSTQAVAPVPMRTHGGLAGSRFATLAEMESQDGESERGGSLTQAEIRRIIREEVSTSSLLYELILMIKACSESSACPNPTQPDCCTTRARLDQHCPKDHNMLVSQFPHLMHSLTL